MPFNPTEREYRKAGDFTPAEARENEENYIVEGYATTFDDPYVLYDDGDLRISETVDRDAFTGADMSDVIMQFDHTGRVYARQKNGTLELSTDDHGLKIRADLSTTPASRELYAEIKAGLISEMSFAFTVAEDDFDAATGLRTIRKIKRVYDVSAVSIPANPSTNISARNYVNGAIDAVKAERLKAENIEMQKRRLRVMLMLQGGENNEN